MEWFQGEAHEAISASKSFGTLLLVLVHDDPSTDPSSAIVLEALDSPVISSRTSLQSTPAFYNLKLKKGSVSYNQFAEVYPIFIVPSIYIIDGLTGKNLDIIGGLNETKTQIITNLSKSLSVAKGEEHTTTTLTPDSDGHQVASTSSSSISAQTIEPVNTTENLAQGASSNQESIDAEAVDPDRAELSARVERVRRVLAEKKAKLEAENSKLKEKERREVGKSLSEHKRRKDEIEMKEAMDERAKDRENDRVALEKVRAQIAQDRADKAARFATMKKEADEEREEKMRLEMLKKAQEAEKLAAQRSTIARIQFRYPDGHHTSTTFDPSANLQALYDFVDADPRNIFGPNNFTLSSSFPSRQLDQESRTVDLKQLGLAPSATVLVFPSARSNGGGYPLVPGNLRSFIALLLTPLTVIWGFVMSFIAPNRSPSNRDGARAAEKRQAEGSGQESQSKRPNTAYQRRNFRREGNIARLGEDSDSDERNTYNGNSTQQM